MAYARRMSSDAFVPADFEVPLELVSDTFRLEPLGPQHNEPDFAAWTSSAEHIHQTPGWVGHDWPDLSMTLQDNLGDLVRHAKDFEQRKGFTYTVQEPGTGETIGCVYIYPSKPAARATPRSSPGCARIGLSWIPCCTALCTNGWSRTGRLPTSGTTHADRRRPRGAAPARTAGRSGHEPVH